MSNEWEAETIFDVLADNRARQVLLATQDSPQSMQKLQRLCEGSASSIYRRLKILIEYGLVKEETRIDPNGHHYQVFQSDFENISISVSDHQIEIVVDDAKHIVEQSLPSANRSQSN
jgi:predicted transcriptional regulator